MTERHFTFSDKYLDLKSQGKVKNAAGNTFPSSSTIFYICFDTLKRLNTFLTSTFPA